MNESVIAVMDVKDLNTTDMFYVEGTYFEQILQSDSRTESMGEENEMYALYGIVAVMIVFGIILFLLIFFIWKLWQCYGHCKYQQDVENMRDIECAEHKHHKTTTIPSIHFKDINDLQRKSALDFRISAAMQRKEVKYVL